ncbi:hypothetical protein WME88_05805 [Sorangium sp. So ce216]
MAAYLSARRRPFRELVIRQALARPSGFAGAVVSGFYEVLKPSFPVAVFDGVGEALAWLGRGDREALVERLIGLRDQAATEIIARDASMIEDSDAWFRLTPEAVRTHRDGVTYDVMGLGPLLTTAVKLLPRPSPERMHDDWLRVTRDVHLADDPITGVIAARDRYDLGATLRAGRLWQRMQLWATARGIAMQPLSQVPEVIDRERQLGRAPAMERSFVDALRLGDWQPTMAFRLGHAVRAGVPGLRRAAEDVIRAS